MSKNYSELRPVLVQLNGRKLEGFFHRFVYNQSNFQTETKALIELYNGKLRLVDLYFVQFTDRNGEKNEGD